LIPILEEQLVITKRLVVRERVILRKHVTLARETVEAELRTEHISVEVDEPRSS
jgi:stress response protein YsnF